MKINDEYVAYCFDEAIAEFIAKLEAGKKPRFPLTEEEKKKRKKNNSGLQFFINNSKKK